MYKHRDCVLIMWIIWRLTRAKSVFFNNELFFEID